jgi:hypothetical protein
MACRGARPPSVFDQFTGDSLATSLVPSHLELGAKQLSVPATRYPDHTGPEADIQRSFGDTVPNGARSSRGRPHREFSVACHMCPRAPRAACIPSQEVAYLPIDGQKSVALVS